MSIDITPTKPYPLRSQSKKLAITTPALIKTTSGYLEENNESVNQHDTIDYDNTSDEEEDIYVAEAIVNSKVEDGVPFYQVRWMGYESDDDSWEPEENILDKSLIIKWEQALQTGTQNKLRSHRRDQTMDPDWEEYSSNSKKFKSKRKLRDGSQGSLDQESVASQEIISTPRKRKKDEVKSESPKTPRTQKVQKTKTPKKSELLRIQHEQEINKRIESRLKYEIPTWNGFDYDMNAPNRPDISCCMVCATREFNRAAYEADTDLSSIFEPSNTSKQNDNSENSPNMDTNSSSDTSTQKTDHDHLLTNIPLFDEVYNDTKNITYYIHAQRPDIPHDTALSIALVRNQFKIVRNLLCSTKSRISPSNSGAGTDGLGYSGAAYLSHYTLGRSIGAVKEARGNKEGDSAFYQQISFDPFELHNKRKQVWDETFYESIVFALRNQNLASKMASFLLVIHEGISYFLKSFGVYEAASAGNREIALTLINEMGDDYGFNHLHKEVLSLKDGEPLTSYRRNQILKMATGNNSINPLQLAALNPDIRYFQELYENLSAAEVCHEDSLGRTVAHFAVVSESVEPLKFLIEKKYNLTKMDIHRITPLLLCAKYGKAHCIPVLLEELTDGAVNETSLTQGWTALHFAAHYGHAKTVAALLSCGARSDILDKETKATPLFHAVKMGYIEAVKILVEQGLSDPEREDKFKRRPIHLACKNGHYEIAAYLLQVCGVDANVGDTSGNCPLHYTAAYGWLALTKLLIEVGNADPNAVNSWKTSPLAIADRKGHMRIVDYLINNPQVNINFPNSSGRTMLHTCCAFSFTSENDEVSTDDDIDVSNKNTNYESKRLIKKISTLLDNRNCNVSIKDINGDTPLHVLITSNVHIMIRKNPKKYSCDTQRRFADEALVILQVQIAQMLIAKGAQLEIKNNAGQTPLQMALEKDKKHMVKFLIEKGANCWSILYGQGLNVLHYYLRAVAEAQSLELDPTPQEWNEYVNRERKIVTGIGSLLLGKEGRKIDMSEMKSLVNKVDKNGYTPILLSFLHAIKVQFERFQEKTNRMERYLDSYEYRQSSSSTISETVKFESLVYQWDFWIEEAQQFINIFKPDMNCQLQLPEDFHLKHPDATLDKEPSRTGWGLLHFAANLQYSEPLKFFLLNGCNPNLQILRHDHCQTPLMLASYLDDENISEKLLTDEAKKVFSVHYRPKKELWQESVRILVDGGANPSVQNSAGETSIMIAAVQTNTSILNGMLSHIQVNWEPSNVLDVLDITTYKSQQTALMMAVIEKRWQAAQMLIDAGANINIADCNRTSTLIQIIRSKNHSLIEYIIGKRLGEISIDFSSISEDRETLLISASRLSQTNVVNFLVESAELASRGSQSSKTADELLLIDTMDKEERTALHLACLNTNLELAQLLIRCNANPNIHSRTPSSPTFSTPLMEAVKKNKLGLVQLLIQAGANVHCTDSLGLSILHHAVNTRNYRVVKALLEAGASPTVVDQFNLTPLHYTCNQSRHQPNKSFKIESLLIQFGADINAQDYQGRTPLHIVFVDIHLIPFMRLNIPFKEKMEKVRDIQEQKEKKQKKIRSKIQQFKLANSSLKTWLLEGLQLELTESDQKSSEMCLKDQTLLHGIYRQQNWETEDKLSQTKHDPIDILRYFLDQKGLKLDVADSFGRTPFHYSARQGAFTCSTYLLKHKADAEAKDMDGLTPFQVGLMYGHVEHCTMLANNGVQCIGEMIVPHQVKQHISTFQYAMCRSFMPLAYLIMDRGVNISAAIYDTLSAGQFHLALMLLSKAQPIQLAEINRQSQNLFHIIVNFRTTSSDWEEYAEEIFYLVQKGNIDINQVDINYQTPLHLATLNNHEILVGLLLKNEADVNVVDSSGKSALWYAVKENNMQITQLILENGGKPNVYNQKAHESVVSIATGYRNMELLKLLLKYGAPASTEVDSSQQNAVMRSIFRDETESELRLNFLKTIVEAGGDVNQASPYTFLDQNQEKKSFITQPILAALEQKEIDIVNILINAGAKCDTKHPVTGEPALLLAIKTCPQVAVSLLENGASVDDVDPETGTSIFYRCLFDQNWLFRKHRELLERQSPNTNLIDPATGQTALEYAIRNDEELIIPLLNLNADPSIKSCMKTGDSLSDKPVNALIQAIMLNNLKAFKILLEHPKGAATMDMMEVDDEGRSVMHVVVSPYKSVSFDNVEMFNILQRFLCKDRLRHLINLQDKYGRSPIYYAKSHKHGKLYSLLLPYSSEPLEGQCQDSNSLAEEMVMDLANDLLLVNVNEDAELQRQKLQLEDLKEREEDARRLNGGVLPHDWNKGVEVDSISHLSQVGKVLLGEHDEPYDILLNKTDVRRGYYGTNMFYKMQLIHNTVQDIYFVWTRWGQIGEQGMHQRTPYNTKEEAETEFKKIFRSKTGNQWEHRSTEEFVEKDGKFIVTRKAYNSSVILKPIDFEKCSQSKLPVSLQAILKMFCDVNSMRQVMLDEETDIPLGYLDRSVIEEGHHILCEIREAVNQLDEANHSTNLDYTVVKEIQSRLATLSNQYFMKIPYRSKQLRGIQSITSKQMLQVEMRRLDNLRYLNGGANIILAAQFRAESINPLDYCYNALGCKWAEVCRASEEFLLINNYMHQSKRLDNYELLHLSRLHKASELNRFKPFSESNNRMLLWHGSKFSNYLGILSQGLRVAPVEAPTTGYMFGKGVYFADMFDKSIAYSVNNSKETRGYSCLLLCEVALGNMYEAAQEKYMEAAQDGYQSTKGLGRYGPDFSKAVNFNHDGLIIPQGPVIERPALDTDNQVADFVLQYNEYIVYDVSQIRIRYVALIKDNNYCSLCNNQTLETEHISALKFSDDKLPGFNRFEQCTAISLLRHNQKSMDQIFHEQVKGLAIESKIYERYWKPSLPPTYTSKVCNDCALKLLSLVIFEYLRLCRERLPIELTSRPECWYGYDCRTQHKNAIHASKYNHICIPKNTGSKVSAIAR